MGGWGRRLRRPQQSQSQRLFDIRFEPFHNLDMPMARRHRRNYNIPGHAHEFTFSCYHGYDFLRSERTCQWLADAINEARSKLDFDVWAYVFMPNHVHLIVRPRLLTSDVALIRKAVKQPVARLAIAWLETHAPHWIPRITRCRGGRIERLFWQSGGGYDRNITDGQTWLKMVDYLHMNPVRKRLVEFPAQWKWSSAAHYFMNGTSPINVDRIPPEWLR
jgi:putative transposase